MTQSGREGDRQIIQLAISPCPNDTFIFYGIASGRLRLDGVDFTIFHHDVETLNRAALGGRYDISKLSFHAWLRVREQYALLQTGAALGYGCGPLLVTSREMDPSRISSCRIAVPGELTTAHLLLRLHSPGAARKVFVRYDEIIPMVASGDVDCGVIIHEDRFTYERAGLKLLVDLGAWWEERTGAPLPLGCIAIRRELAPSLAGPFDDLVRHSIALSRKDISPVLPYIREHAQQMDAAVLEQHIATFVNESSVDLGEDGRRAVAALETLARDAGVIP